MTTEYVETRLVPLDELVPYPGNARRGDRASLVESLEENGQYRSLVVRRTPDGELIVLAGNNTLAALEHKGEDKARCEIVTCDDATALRVNLVDNKSNDKATYDDEARARLLDLLDGKISGTGYDEDEVDSIMARYEEEEEAPYTEPEIADYNDDETEREQRILSHGGHDSRTMASRGIRDIILAMPVAEADELGRMIMKLREELGSLSQADVILRACRVAVHTLFVEGPSSALDVVDEPYAPELEDD